ncbi:hypothetical protein [Vulcanisaeta distributa]|uniref:hypothetical protein n=1 Tax=Vulcanisaeta distributa TaxID=164451 RepID=UPI000AA9D9C9|nr:hypothetical protein [Vulcanisaeta distributa]
MIGGEPTNFRTFSELVNELGFLGEGRFERVGSSSWLMALGLSSSPVGTPYAIIGVEVSQKWYYALMPFTRPIEELVSMAHQMLGPTYLSKLGLVDNAIAKLFRAVKH